MLWRSGWEIITDPSTKPGLIVLGICSSEAQVADCRFLVNKPSSVYVVLQRRHFTKLITVKWNWLENKKKPQKKKRKENGNRNMPILKMQKLYPRDDSSLRWKPAFDSLRKYIHQLEWKKQHPPHGKVCVGMGSSQLKLDSIWYRKWMGGGEVYPKIQGRKG